MFLQSCTTQEQPAYLENTPPQTSSFDVSEDMAVRVAKSFSHDQAFLNNPSKTVSRSQMRSANFVSDKKVKNILPFKDGTDNKALLYAINFDPKGFVIVAGNKKEAPILAFSEDGYFTLPDDKTNGIYSWLDFTKQKIKYLKTHPEYKESTNTKSQWDNFSFPTGDDDDEVVISGGTVKVQVGPLTVTTWDQGRGYNDMLAACSTGGDNGRVWTGCVATAVAQIMYYWQSPSYYDWSSMSVNSGVGDTPRLMRDIGHHVEMDYGCESSGTQIKKAAKALKKNYGYRRADCVNYVSSTATAQLGSGRPLIFKGKGVNSETGVKLSHAWVCDGYRFNRHISIHNPGTEYEYETYTNSPVYFRMNWGWGTHGGNGWFRYNDFTPGTRNYNLDRKMIIIHP